MNQKGTENKFMEATGKEFGRNNEVTGKGSYGRLCRHQGLNGKELGKTLGRTGKELEMEWEGTDECTYGIHSEVIYGRNCESNGKEFRKESMNNASYRGNLEGIWQKV